MKDHPDFSEAALSITDGQTTIGFVFESGTHVTATDAEGNSLGSFATRSDAHHAIIESRKEKLRIATAAFGVEVPR